MSTEPVTTEEYFGGCPHCGKTSGYVDVGLDHWFACDEHRARWCAGSNLFSSCQEERTVEDRISEANVLGYEVVEPIYPAADAPVRTEPYDSAGEIPC